MVLLWNLFIEEKLRLSFVNEVKEGDMMRKWKGLGIEKELSRGKFK